MKRITKLVAAAFGAVAMFVGSARADYKLETDETWTDVSEHPGTIDLNGHKLTVSSFAGNATITDSTALGENIIQDGSFEAATIPNVNSGLWAYFKNGVVSSCWQAPGDSSARVGITKNGKPWTTWVSGTKAAFVQCENGDGSDVTLQQEVQVPADGKYLLKYSYLWRDQTKWSQRLEVHVDDGPVCGFTDSGASVAVKEVVLDLTAGPHTIKFVGTTPYDDHATTVIDDVSLRRICSAGELHVLVQEGQTVENATVAITGPVCLVKEGAGTFVANKAGQTYSGGTLVAAGTAKSALDIDNAPWGAAGASIEVSSGATLDINGKYRYDLCPIILDGGTLANSVGHNNKTTVVAIGDITLKKDSTFSSTQNTVFGCSGGHVTIDLGGHTFTMGNILFLEGCTFTGGGTLVTSGSHFYPYQTADDFRGVACRIGSTSFMKTQPVDFGDLEMLSTVTTLSNGSVVRIHGVFTVAATQRLHNFQMQDGSTINLANRTLPWRTFGEGTGYSSNAKADWLTYAEGATVKVDLTGKNPADGTVVLEWSEAGVPQAGVTFIPWANGARVEGVDLVVTSTGCILKKQVVTATWSNDKGDGNAGDPQNWICYDKNHEVLDGALPTTVTAVTVPNGSTLFSAATASALNYASLTIAGTAVLGADCDWQGMNVTRVSGCIDLRGFDMTVALYSNLTNDNPLTITDSVEEGGELHLIVASGTVENGTMSLGGSLKLVKEGAGTFVANKAGQTYSGGTLVSAGTAKSALDIDNAPWGAAGASIEVSSGATLDINGKYRYDLCPIVLDGGTLANSVKLDNKTTVVAVGDITLTKDSTFSGTQDTVFGCSGGHTTIDLGGHTFAMAGVLFLEGCTFTGGGTLVTSGSHFYPYQTADDFRGVACRIGSAQFVKGQAVDFGDLEMLSSTTLAYANAVRIHGVFTVAATQRLHMFQMQDGSTINLANRTLPWKTFGEGTGYSANAKPDWLTYAEGATVKVDLTGKNVDASDGDVKILSWDSEGCPAKVKFVAIVEDGRDAPRLVKRADGLYATAKGFMAIIR